MATHSSVLAWRFPGTAEPGELPSIGSHRVRHDWSNLAAAATAPGSSTILPLLSNCHQIFHTSHPCRCCSIWLGILLSVYSDWETLAHLSVFRSKDIPASATFSDFRMELVVQYFVHNTMLNTVLQYLHTTSKERKLDWMNKLVNNLRNGNPLQYSCLGNPMDRGAYWATVHEVAKSDTRLSD